MRAAIGAIINLDGGPVDLRDLESLATRARLPWGSNPRLFRGEGFGLVWVPVRTEAAPPCGDPLTGSSGQARCEVVVDGTLDNRAELARDLGLSPDAAGLSSESHLIGAAYEKWGIDFLPRLIGEFAFLLWDRAERRLLAARDVFGLRELFYNERDEQVRIASQLRMILPNPSLSDLNEEYVAEFLAVQFSCGPATPFNGAVRLQAGHQMTVSAGQLSTRRFWDVSDHQLPRDWAAGEYAERFLSLFQEGVARCLATGSMVWAELSGGLDSSSIACLSQEILRSDPSRSRDLATVTFVFDEMTQCDERRWSQPVVQQCGLVNHQIRCDDLFFEGAFEASCYRNEPHFGILCHPMFVAESELLRNCGADVLLSGSRAESVVLADLTPPVHLAEHLRRWRLRAFAGELLRWQRGTHRPLINLFLQFALQPLLHQNRYFRSSDDAAVVNPWVNKSFARRMNFRDRVRATRVERRLRDIAQQLQYERLSRSEQMVHRGFSEWSCEIRYPFLYRPLVELALAVPWEQKVTPREGKLLLRRSMEGRLPDVVRTRQGSAGPGPAMYAPQLAFAMPGGLSVGANETVPPRTGRLVMFPAWLLHQVRPYRGGAERISIAFNLSL